MYILSVHLTIVEYKTEYKKYKKMNQYYWLIEYCHTYWLKCGVERFTWNLLAWDELFGNKVYGSNWIVIDRTLFVFDTNCFNDRLRGYSTTLKHWFIHLYNA